MAVVDQYTSNVLGQGQINSQATPADFGAQVGAATQNLAAGMDDVAKGLYKVEQDQGRIWAYSATSKKYTELQQQFAAQKNALDPSDPEFTQKVNSLGQQFQDQFDAATTDLQNQAPSRSAARVVASHMAENRAHLMHTTMVDQAQMLGTKTIYDTQEGLKEDQDSIAADPSNENYNRILESRKQSIGGLQTISPELKMKANEQSANGLAAAQVDVLASTKPQDFLAAVNAQGGRVTPRGSVKGAVPGGAPTASPATSAAGFDGAMSFVFAKEGGYVANDAGKGPTNFGINQTANPDVDVANLTKAGAADIYRKRYWNAIGGDNLDPAMQTVAMNAAVNMGVGPVKDMLKMAGGNPEVFTDLVKTRYQTIASNNPSKAQYLQAWIARADSALASSPKPGYVPANSPDGTTVASAPADLPQVQPLTDQDIAGSDPAIAGWGRLTWTQKVASVRKAEAAVGGQLASERGAMDRDLRDVQSTLLAGKSYPGIEDPRFSPDNLTKLYGPVDGPRKADQLNYLKQVGGFMGQMATMPAAQAQATLQQLEPQGGPEFADKNPVYKAANEAYARLDNLRGKDFMQWANETGVANVKPVDMTDATKFQNSLHARIAVAQSGINDYRTDAQLLSKDEAANLGDSLNRMNPQQQMSYIKAMKDGTAGQGDWFNNVIKQIAPKNTTLAYAAGAATRQGAVQTAGGQQDGNTVGQYILEGAHILQGKDLEDPTHTGRPLNLDDKQFRTMFWSNIGSDAFKSLDATRANQVASDTYQSVKNYLAADIYHRGLKPDAITSDEVKNAITAVTGGNTKVGSGDNVFLPWGTDESTFKQQFMPRAQDAINRAGLAGTALDKLDAYHFVNVDEGKYGFMNGNKMLTGKDGRTVLIDYGTPMRNLNIAKLK
ncbi:Protein of unknown function DUF847 [uncultured Caudovirales phage]|uniref:TtsA-like Glycoside hydrolase family 108 domain-containing protein n=1 Tax=uncultured Caudovirales phage TaxID=2100421 RepID=A0A6J7W1S9_9CAUD|nr:Protein of unknown function DUF847 [uncultured Caudovirales phage]